MPDAAVIEIAEYRKDVVSALRFYFSHGTKAAGVDLRARLENENMLAARLVETDQRSVFFVLARLEAVFRMDYESRCRNRMKDDLSRAFRRVRKSQRRVRLDEDIFELWRAHLPASRQLVAELRGAFKFRHWLAHGRFWAPKLGRSKYDFNYAFDLAEAVFGSLPLYDLADME